MLLVAAGSASDGGEWHDDANAAARICSLVCPPPDCPICGEPGLQICTVTGIAPPTSAPGLSAACCWSQQGAPAMESNGTMAPMPQPGTFPPVSAAPDAPICGGTGLAPPTSATRTGLTSHICPRTGSARPFPSDIVLGSKPSAAPLRHCAGQYTISQDAVFLKRVDVIGQLTVHGGMSVTSDERVTASLAAALPHTRAVDRCMHGRKQTWNDG
jgi:hypothetical protein